MLIEEVDHNKVVSCLLCKTSFRVAGAAGAAGAESKDPGTVPDKIVDKNP
jgi:hypothetical protein